MKRQHIIEMKNENTQLRNNVKELQEQLQYSYKRISALTKQHEECIRISRTLFDVYNFSEIDEGIDEDTDE